MHFIHRGFLGFVTHAHYKVIPIEKSADPETLGVLLVDFIQKVNYKSNWWTIRERIDAIRFDDVMLVSPKKMLETLLQTDDVLVVSNGLSAAMDSEHTDIGYVINLDTKMLEIFIGNQHTIDPDSPFGLLEYTKGFYPCKCIATIPLLDITVKDVVTAFDQKRKTKSLPPLTA